MEPFLGWIEIEAVETECIERLLLRRMSGTLITDQAVEPYLKLLPRLLISGVPNA